jgi:hypothetical protein
LEGGQGHRSPLTSRNTSPTQGFIFYASPSNKWEFWVGNDHSWETVSGSDIALNVWSHLAVTLRGNHLKLYVNGRLEAEKTIANYSLNNSKPLRIGAGVTEGNPDYLFPGQIDEVQIWNQARSEAEIQSDMNRRLTGNEPGLMGYWQFTGGIAKDYSPNGYHGQIFGQPSIVASAIQDKQIYGFAGVGNLFLKSKESAPMAQWHHLSAVYNQSYALQFKGNGFLECNHNPTLDLDRDLSIEVFLQVGSLNQRQGILTKGKLGDGTTQNVPYSLYLDTDGKIAFAFEDKQGRNYVYKSSEADSFIKLLLLVNTKPKLKIKVAQKPPM